MKHTTKLSVLFGLLGVLLLASTAFLGITAREAPVRLLAVSRDARQRTESYMDALCRFDLASAGEMMSGQPRLDAGGEPDSQLGELLWSAYTESLSYSFSGDCYASGSGLCRDVQVEMLDIPALLDLLKAQSQELLEQRAAAEENQDLVFDENGQFREEFAMMVLRDGAAAILKETEPLTSRTLTLSLTCQDGRWYILPDPAITDILTGNMGG